MGSLFFRVVFSWDDLPVPVAFKGPHFHSLISEDLI